MNKVRYLGQFGGYRYGCQLTSEIQPLVPGIQVAIVVDHNYSE